MIVVAGLAAVQFFAEEPPAVGDCLTDAPTADEMVVVDCQAGDAYWSVVGEDGTWTFADFEAAQPGEVCAGHPTSHQALWITSARSVVAETEGEVVCLQPVAEPADSTRPTGRPTG